MIEIIPAGAQHDDTIAEILRAAFQAQAAELGMTPEQHPYYVAFETAERVCRRRQEGDQIALALLQGEPVGTVSFRLLPTEPLRGELKRLAVLPSYRGRRYGDRLVAYAEARMAAAGVAIVQLCLVAQFERLRQYYLRLGYTSLGICTSSGFPLPIVNMEKHLTT